jgi:hypothetical protein
MVEVLCCLGDIKLSRSFSVLCKTLLVRLEVIIPKFLVFSFLKNRKKDFVKNLFIRNIDNGKYFVGFCSGFV